jgi:hypothetical protein
MMKFLLLIFLLIVGVILLKWFKSTIRRIINIVALFLVLVFVIGAFLYITGNPV